MRRKEFINREIELKSLEELWTKEDFALVIIYGRPLHQDVWINVVIC